MTDITTAILNHPGKHPDRLAMSRHTYNEMICENEYARFMNFKQPRLDEKRFGPTPIHIDDTIPYRAIDFQRRGAMTYQYVTTHRVVAK